MAMVGSTPPPSNSRRAIKNAVAAVGKQTDQQGTADVCRSKHTRLTRVQPTSICRHADSLTSHSNHVKVLTPPNKLCSLFACRLSARNTFLQYENALTFVVKTTKTTATKNKQPFAMTPRNVTPMTGPCRSQTLQMTLIDLVGDRPCRQTLLMTGPVDAPIMF